jgi:hypothetical protein
MAETRNALRNILVWKTEKMGDIMKLDLLEICHENVNWI